MKTSTNSNTLYTTIGKIHNDILDKLIAKLSEGIIFKTPLDFHPWVCQFIVEEVVDRLQPELKENKNARLTICCDTFKYLGSVLHDINKKDLLKDSPLPENAKRFFLQLNTEMNDVLIEDVGNLEKALIDYTIQESLIDTELANCDAHVRDLAQAVISIAKHSTEYWYYNLYAYPKGKWAKAEIKFNRTDNWRLDGRYSKKSWSENIADNILASMAPSLVSDKPIEPIGILSAATVGSTLSMVKEYI